MDDKETKDGYSLEVNLDYGGFWKRTLVLIIVLTAMVIMFESEDFFAHLQDMKKLELEIQQTQLKEIELLITYKGEQ